MTGSGLALVSNLGSPVVTPDTISGLASLTARWYRQPVDFATTTFTHPPFGSGPVTVDPEQARILQAIADHDRVAVRTGRGVGKTAAAAIIVHWWLSTRAPAVVVTSAGTWSHLEDKLWPEIHQWGRQWTLAEAFEFQTMGIYNKDNPYGIRAEAISSDTPVNVEGFHSPHLLILIDEAKGMTDEIYDSLRASLTGESGLEQKIVALSTPPLSKQGWFARVSSGSEWVVVHVSGLDSPRVSRTYVEEILKDYGEDSPQYQSYVLGNIPESSSETVIALSWVEACQALSPCTTKKNTRRPVITCDVAREGDDLSTFGIFDRASFSLVQFSDGCTGWVAKKSLMEIVARCRQAVTLHPTCAAICIDDTGLGGGVTDRLRELQSEGKFPSTCTIMAVKFGSKAAREDRFKSKKDELWWAGREIIRESRIALPTDDEIRAWHCPRGSDFKLQLTSPIYEYDSSDRIVVQDKRVSGRERTKSLPTKSPDLAHAFILGVRYYMKQNRLETEGEEPAASQGEALWRKVRDEASKTNQPVSQNPYDRRR